MKKLLTLVLFAAISSSAFAFDLNHWGTVSVSVDAVGLFQNELTVRADYRFATAYSVELGVTYGYGGRAAHPEGSFIDIVPAIKSFPVESDSKADNWYLKVLGKTRFLFSSLETQYGLGAGFGYDRVFSNFLLNPELTSEILYGQDLTLALRLGAGFAR